MLSSSFSTSLGALVARVLNLQFSASAYFLPFQVHNSAAAVQPSGPRGARLGGAPGYHSIRIHRRPRHLQRGDNALGAAAGHNRADAQRTHAPTGEGETNMVSFSLSFSVHSLCFNIIKFLNSTLVCSTEGLCETTGRFSKLVQKDHLSSAFN